MTRIRAYSVEDYKNISGWWKFYDETPPSRLMMPEDSSWILEDDDGPLLCVTVYLTNSKELAWVDNLIGRPKADKSLRREATMELLKYIGNVSRELGYEKLFCFSEKPELKRYYMDIGFIPTMDNVTTFVKPL